MKMMDTSTNQSTKSKQVIEQV
uniref:Uncharacterized protein n=1 Tax=Arundo donax TaxID=35708 RepID=A0A0A9H6Z0_ARUDO